MLMTSCVYDTRKGAKTASRNLEFNPPHSPILEVDNVSCIRLCSYLCYVMPILQTHPKPKVTLEEARASGRLIEYESAGVTYAYTPDNRWINGHEWASPREIEEKTENWQRPKPTRSWLVAQCLWWNLWRPGLKCPRDLTKVHLAGALYDRIMGGGVSQYRQTDSICSCDEGAVDPSEKRLGGVEGRLERKVRRRCDRSCRSVRRCRERP
jgi:hypothetical protein